MTYLDDDRHHEDPTLEQAKDMLAGQMADGLRAIEDNHKLTSELARARALLAVHDARNAQISETLKTLSSERDFYMRYAATMSARLDNIGCAVMNAATEINENGRAFETIVRVAREQSDKAHGAYLLLNSLMATIEAAKLDARDAAFRPKTEGAKVQEQHRPDASAQGQQRETLPSVVRRGPRIAEGGDDYGRD